MKYFTPWTTTLLASEVGAGHRRLRLTAIFSFLGGPEGSRRADRQQRARSRRRASSRCAAPLRGAGDGGHVRNRDLPRDPGGERAAAIAADLGLTLSAPGGSRSMPSRRDQDAPDQARASRLRTVLCGPRVDARKLIQYTIAAREAYPVRAMRASASISAVRRPWVGRAAWGRSSPSGRAWARYWGAA